MFEFRNQALVLSGYIWFYRTYLYNKENLFQDEALKPGNLTITIDRFFTDHQEKFTFPAAEFLLLNRSGDNSHVSSAPN